MVAHHLLDLHFLATVADVHEAEPPLDMVLLEVVAEFMEDCERSSP